MLSSFFRKPLLSLCAAAMLVFAISVTPALAQLVEPQTGFEIEGDTPVGNIGGTLDWENAVAPAPPDPPANHILDPHSKNDAFAGPETDIFKPAGKFDEPENWSIQGGSVGPAQNELTNIFAYPITPDQLAPGSPTDTWLFMGMERTKKEGTFALDFEFNQMAWDGMSGTLVRTPGDLAVGFELSGNPTDPLTDLQVLIVQFVGPGGPAPNKCDNNIVGPKLITVGTGTDACLPYGTSGWYYRFLADAGILATSGLGAATMNPDAFTHDNFASTDAQGNDDAGFVGQFEFAEAGINLTALGLEPGCPGFGSVHAKTRSSLEVGSDLKDLAGPQNLPVQCFIEGQKYLDLNGNGDQDGGEPPLAGWEIQLSGDASATVFTDANGEYRFENLADGSYTVTEVCPVATPAWVQTEPGQFTEDACGAETYSFAINIDNKSEVGDFGNGAPAIDVTKMCTAVVEVGGDIDYDFTVKNTGNVNLVNVELDDPTTGFNQTGLSLAPGAMQDFAQSVTAPGTAQSIDNTVTATGDYGSTTVFKMVSDTDVCNTTVVDAKIEIEPDDTNEVGENHTFTVTVMKNEGSGFVAADDGTIVTVTLTDANGAVSNTSSNSCLTGTVGGTCTITFTSDTAGTVTGHASATIDSGGLMLFRETDGTGDNSDDAVKTFVDAKITIEPDDTNEVGDPHTFTVTVMEDDGSGAGFVAAAGEHVDFTLTNANGAAFALDATASTCDDAGANTDGSGQCVIVFTSDTAGTVTGHASSSVSVGGLSLLRETDGTGDNGDDAVKTFVDAKIAIEPDDTNGIGEEHAFTVTVMEDDGSGAGFVAAAGEHVDFTLTNGGGASFVLDATASTCDDAGANTDASGQCVIVFTSNTAGTVTGHASSSVSVGGISVFRETDGVAPNSDDAVKTFVAGSIKWFKVDANNNPLGGATFEVCRTNERPGLGGAAINPPECVTVLDNSAPDADNTAGTFLLVGLELGTWTVDETVPPPGFRGDDKVETVVLTLSNPDAVISDPWVNTTLGMIAPTQTTCTDFVTGTAGDLTQVQYGVKDGVINQTNPGVFFYYTQVSAPSGTQVKVLQTDGTFNLFQVQNNNQVRLFDASCNVLPISSFTALDGQVMVTVSGPTAGDVYIISVKYETSEGIVGEEEPGIVHYDFRTEIGDVIVDFDADGLNLVPKP